MSRQPIPPQNIEAERATLGTMLLNPEAVLNVLDVLGDNKDAFYVDAHQRLYGAMTDLYRENTPVDMVTLTENLKERGYLERCGGAAYIAELTDAVPTSSRASYYAEIVLEHWKRRMVIVSCQRAIGEAYSGENEAVDVAKDLLSGVGDVLESGRESMVAPLIDGFPEMLEEIQYLRERNMEVTGAPTGLQRLDTLLLGLREATLNIIGSRPGLGKTALAINMANNLAASGHPVLMFSLEMRRQALLRRFVSLNTLTPYRTLSGTSMVEIQNKKLRDAAGRMSNAKLYVDDSTRLSVYNLTARCRRFAALHEGIMPVFFLDYLQLCEFGQSKSKQRYELIGEFTRELKLLSGELNCPFVVLCQLSRTADALDDPFKAIGSLRESGNIEADADTISVSLQQKPKWLEETAKKYNIEAPESVMNFAVIKNREGPVGMCPLVFDKSRQHIQTLETYCENKDAENAVPEQEELL